MAVAFAMRALNPDEAEPRPRIRRSMATLDFRIDFIRAAKRGRDVIGETECLQHRRRRRPSCAGWPTRTTPAIRLPGAQAAFMLTELPPGA